MQKHRKLYSGVYSGVDLAEEVADGAAALAWRLSHGSGAGAAEAPRQNTRQKSLLKAVAWALRGGSDLPKRRQPSPAQVQQAHADIGLGRAGGQNPTRHESRQSIATGHGFRRSGCCTTLLSQGLQAVAPSKRAATDGHTETEQQRTTRIQCTQQRAKPVRDTQERLMLVAAARRSAGQGGTSYTK